MPDRECAEDTLHHPAFPPAGTEAARAVLDRRLQQVLKLELIGQFAAGIARDFAGLVATIERAAEQLADALTPDGPARAHAETIQRTAAQAHDLTRRLLAFSQPQSPTIRELNLNDLVERALPRLRHLLPPGVSLEWQPSACPEMVRADEGELTQSLVDLIANARDSLPGGGVVTVASGHEEVGPAWVADHPWAREGCFATLTVADGGIGMPPEVLARVFEPFFTTKPSGQGTGLGLPLVFATVKRHDGMLDLTSRPGAGTTVRLLLPRLAAPGHGSGETTAVIVAGTEARHETILLAEDAFELRRMVARVLRALGYHVVEATDGDEALAVVAAGTHAVDLVLADVVMPRLGGVELFQQARRLNPRLAFLFSSGYAEEDIGSAIPRQPRVGTIPKPYRIDALAAKIRELLDEPA